jgi:hypothetical protein
MAVPRFEMGRAGATLRRSPSSAGVPKTAEALLSAADPARPPVRAGWEAPGAPGCSRAKGIAHWRYWAILPVDRAFPDLVT